MVKAENNKKERTNTCVICGKTFVMHSPNQKLCGDPNCMRARRREYAHKHPELYKELSKKYRQQPRVKAYRSLYDKQYQIEHKEQIRAYKKMYFQKKRFFNYLEKGEVLKNSYYFSLSKEEQQSYLNQLKH